NTDCRSPPATEPASWLAVASACALSPSPIEIIGVPTSTVWPSSTSSASTAPSNGLGNSTTDLAVSISTMTSLMATVSPTATRQATISASVSPSPTSGSLYSLTRTSSEGQGPVDSVQDAIDIGQVFVFDAAGR